MKKITFKYTKSGKVNSLVVDDAEAYISMMHNVMKSTPIEVLSIVEASHAEASSVMAQESYFTKYGTACE